MKQPFKLVYVEWEDAFGCSPHWTTLPGDEGLEEVTVKPLLAKSVGWVIREKGTSITIVPHLSMDHAHAEAQGCGDMTIPRSAIRKMACLKIPDTSKTGAAARRVMRRKSAKPGKPPPGSKAKRRAA